METTHRNSNVGLGYGLITGLIVCIITLIQYMGGLKWYLSPVGFLTYIIVIVMAVLAGLKQKKNNGGYLEFKDALKVTFSVFASAFLLQTLFTYVLLNFIDVTFKQAVGQEVINKSEEFMRSFGASESQIDEAMEKAGEKDSFSLGSMILGYGIWCIVWFLVSLIIAAIIKKNKPVFPNA